MDPDTYKAYYGSFGANNFEDLMLVIGKKQATASTLLDKVIPNHTGFFDNLSKMLKKIIMLLKIRNVQIVAV